MSEETAGQQQAPNPRLVQISAILAGILAITILFWIQGFRMAMVKRQAFGRGVDGIAASLAIPVIELSSQRFENRADRLQRTLEAIQRSGQYQIVVVTDPNGKVLATTDTSLKSQTLNEMKSLKSPSIIKEDQGVIEVNAPIIGDGESLLGGLKIKVKI